MPVVAAHTGPEYLGVIHGDDRLPERNRVTILAHVAGLEVTGRFSRSVHAVVTSDAIRADIAMIEKHQVPTGINMTGFALSGCLHMV